MDKGGLMNRLEFLFNTAADSLWFKRFSLQALIKTISIFIIFSCAVTLSAQNSAQTPCTAHGDTELECSSSLNSLAMNFIQAIGSHNSYKLAIPAPELALIRAYREQSAITLDYSHLTLTQQLELGMRQIELDIVYDPDGGRYANPLLPRQTVELNGAQHYDNSNMVKPGFKVLHAQDIDVRSNCDTWIICLTEIKSWSEKNPQHVPILIMFNAKTGGSAYPGVTEALPFDSQAFYDLDQEVLSVFDKTQLITPDDVRGNFHTLKEAVTSKGWPSLASTKGKIFFALDEGPEKVQIYSRGNASLQGLPIFVNSIDENADHAAYFTMNNPIRDQERIRAAVKSGFIVRTRADANTMEARNNDSSRREAAFSSGAQYISTDYYHPRLEFSEYSVSLPEKRAARCNPLLLNADCSAR
ncbi:MAG: hypothetical protein ACI85S_002926 [Pseudohongiellaceae bacterium]|jgi:hypothetical protein